jgi:hypothetical protein
MISVRISGAIALSVLTTCPVLAADLHPSTAIYAGTVKTLTGEAWRQDIHGDAPQALHVGDRVQEGDQLHTAGASSVGVTLADDTLVSMGAESRFVIQRFSFDPQTNHGNLIGHVLRGTMAFVTGLIAKMNPGNMEIHTPAATVGIRGTEFIVDVPAEESSN